MVVGKVLRNKNMNTEKYVSKEHQTVRLFATLGVLTIIAVLLFKVVLFGPTRHAPRDMPNRTPAESFNDRSIIQSTE